MYNWAANPSFTPLFFTLYADGSLGTPLITVTAMSNLGDGNDVFVAHCGSATATSST